ncbi:MAG: hypothetical protein ACI9G1_004563 [Pirellulaceae bacterium]|jgi:hypothetical protein
MEEGHALAGGGALLILIASISQLPGLLIAYWRWKKNSVAALPMLFGAYAVASTGTVIYGVYAFDGQADSINSAAHMHVIAFPILHCLLATAIYLPCGIISAVLSRFRGGTGNSNATQ